MTLNQIIWPIFLPALLVACGGGFILFDLARGRVEEPILGAIAGAALMIGGLYGVAMGLGFISPL